MSHVDIAGSSVIMNTGLYLQVDNSSQEPTVKVLSILNIMMLAFDTMCRQNLRRDSFCCHISFDSCSNVFE
jgi:hypothetical protein